MKVLDFSGGTRLRGPGRVIFVAAMVMAAAAAGQEQPPVRIVSVRPTVFFVKGKDAVAQVAEVEIESDTDHAEVSVVVKTGSREQATDIGTLKKGKTTVQAHVLDVTEPAGAEFVVKAGDKVVVRHKAQWEPQRRWEVYFVPITHHDLGYTDRERIADIRRKGTTQRGHVAHANAVQLVLVPQDRFQRFAAQSQWAHNPDREAVKWMSEDLGHLTDVRETGDSLGIHGPPSLARVRCRYPVLEHRLQRGRHVRGQARRARAHTAVR